MAELAAQAQELASKGRFGDTQLVHMSPAEVGIMSSMTPGGLTTNPDTGQPEAFAFLLPALGAGLGWWGAGALRYGALGTGLMMGLGAFGGGLAAGQKPGKAALGGLAAGAMGGLGSYFGGNPLFAEQAALGGGMIPMAAAGPGGLSSVGGMTDAVLTAGGTPAAINPGSLSEFAMSPYASQVANTPTSLGGLGQHTPAAPYAAPSNFQLSAAPPPLPSPTNVPVAGIDAGYGFQSPINATSSDAVLRATQAFPHEVATNVSLPPGFRGGAVAVAPRIQYGLGSDWSRAAPWTGESVPMGVAREVATKAAAPVDSVLPDYLIGDARRALDPNAGFGSQALAFAKDNPFTTGIGALSVANQFGAFDPDPLENYPTLASLKGDPIPQAFPAVRTRIPLGPGEDITDAAYVGERLYFNPVERIRGFQEGGEVRREMTPMGGGQLPPMASPINVPVAGIDTGYGYQPPIKWNFISKLEEPAIKVGYVPDAENSQSGVTIGTGFDLGSKDEDFMKRIGVSQNITDKLKPFFSLKGAEAEEVASNLVLSDSEVKELDQASKNYYANKIIQKYETDSGKPFDALSSEQQTVITSVGFQYGSFDRTPAFWAAVINGDWEGVEKELRNFGDNYFTRRDKEADLLGKKAPAIPPATNVSLPPGGLRGEYAAAPGIKYGLGSDARREVGYALGGEVRESDGSDRIIVEAEAALMGNHPNPEEAVQRFIDVFGMEAFKQLRQKVMEAMSGEAQASGIGRLIRGPGTGTSDSIPANIDGREEVRLSDGEYVIPRNAVDAAGGGDNAAGADTFDQIVDDLQAQPGTPGSPGGIKRQEIIPRGRRAA